MTKSELLQELCAEAKSTSVMEHGPFGNIYLRPMEFPDVGSVVRGHTHRYDHVTIVTLGILLLRAYRTDPHDPEHSPVGPAIEEVLKAPAMARIRKGMWHEFTALERAHAVCVFALRDRDGVVTEQESNDWVTTCSY